MWKWTWHVQREQRGQCTFSKVNKGESGDDAVREVPETRSGRALVKGLAFIPSKMECH